MSWEIATVLGFTFVAGLMFWQSRELVNVIPDLKTVGSHWGLKLFLYLLGWLGIASVMMVLRNVITDAVVESSTLVATDTLAFIDVSLLVLFLILFVIILYWLIWWIIMYVKGAFRKMKDDYKEATGTTIKDFAVERT